MPPLMIIKLLNEHKQAIISRAVTRGIDSNVRLKPSGIEWLGDIPEHWEIKKIRSISRPISERNQPDFPLLSVVRDKGIILRESQTFDENKNYIPDDLTNYKVVHPGNLVINKMKAWQGSLGISDLKGIVSPAYFVYKISSDYNGKYLHYLLRTRQYIDLMSRISKGIRPGQWDLDPQSFKQIPVPVISLSEQEEIVKQIEIEIKSIASGISNLENEIALIFEYRTRIIFEAITGKVDVRNIIIDEIPEKDFEEVFVESCEPENIKTDFIEENT
jgi:type I restriction enzyme S subunit